MNSSIFNAADYAVLADIVFRDGYPGYRPTIREAPNGDGHVDTGKRFAHVAQKYLVQCPTSRDLDLLQDALEECHAVACEVAHEMDVPYTFWPDIRYSCLRILEYPAGVGSHEHTDFDLFTLACYRNLPDHLAIRDRPWAEVRAINDGCHLGELAEELRLGKASAHCVFPGLVTQHSIVYFAIPDHAAVLPAGDTVGEWLEERVARSRTY